MTNSPTPHHEMTATLTALCDSFKADVKSDDLIVGIFQDHSSRLSIQDLRATLSARYKIPGLTENDVQTWEDLDLKNTWALHHAFDADEDIEGLIDAVVLQHLTDDALAKNLSRQYQVADLTEDDVRRWRLTSERFLEAVAELEDSALVDTDGPYTWAS